MKNTSKLKKPALFKTIGIIFITMWALLSVAGIVMGAVAPAGTPISDGFDYPVGIPDGIGYAVEGYGGLAFLEKYDYLLDGYPEYHPGEDWNDDDSGHDWNGDSNDAGDPVYAISNGIVRYAQYQSEGWGYLVLIEHKLLSGKKFMGPDGTGLTTVWSQYGHLASIDPNIQKNQPVRRRQQIGTVGDYPHGSGEAYHLHFEIRVQYRDPWAFVHNTWSNETDYQPWPESRVRVYYTDPSDFISQNRPQTTPLIGDWNGNNIDTTGTFDPRTSSFSLDNGATPLMGEPGDLPLVGDWDGSDGKDTIGVYRPKTAQFFLDDNNDGIRDYDPINFGDMGDFPIVGDWDGDGGDNIGVFRSLDFATWKTTFFLNKSDGSVERIEFGQETDIPIVGDWDNDGKDDTGVFRRNDPDHENNAVFYLKIGTETIDIVYGNNDDIPIVGKWDSDGLTKIGVYRPTTQQFIFNHTPLVDSGDHPIWYVDDDLQDYPNADFTRIQDAVDAASDGDTIIVYPGTYTENVDVNKDYITIKSENGAESTFIQAADPDDHVFEIIGDYVNISGFTATGATQGVGFHLHGDYCNISYNNALNNYHGISLYRSNNNQIKENAVVSNGFYGIFLMESSYNGVLNNIAEDNARAGILINPESNYNNIKGNTASNNNCGIALTSDNNNNIIRLNIISLNNFISNIYHNAYSYDSTNIWNSQEQITYTYQGSTYTNYLGNHWGDYTGSDTDGDGIGDEPYSFPPQGRIDNYPLIEPFENYLPTPPPENQPPTCAIKLQKTGVPIANINVGEFFDIYVGGSTDDQGITKVRFSSDDSQDGNPTGEWTDWYDWDTSSGDWNAANKIKAWSFATGGDKEVWAEVKDGDGQTDKGSADIYANQLPIAKPVITFPLEITPVKDIYYVGDTIRAEFTIKNEGTASITFDILTVGGRLNGECPIAGCPDFTHKSLTLQPGESYHYEGSLTLHPGNYQFFIAYYIENPTPDEKKLLDENNWNTCVDLGVGLTDEDRRADISVSPINPAPSNLEVRGTGNFANTQWGIGGSHFLTWNYNYNFDNVKGFVIQEKFVPDWRIFVLNPKCINWPYPIGFHEVATVGPSLRGDNIATHIPNTCSAHTKEYRIATIFTDNLLSEWSNVATISPSTISPPSKLEATVSKEPLQVKLTWKDMSDNEMGFNIYRWGGLGIGPWFEQAGKEWPLLATVDTNVETFIDTDVRLGYTFKYIIKAFNDVDLSPSPNGVMVYIPVLDEVPPPLTNSPPNIIFANLKSPGELRIYDSQNRVTGLINGEIKEEIHDSIYDEHNEIVVVFSSTDTYRHEVAGTDGGTYGLDITSVDNGEAATFTATDIPTAAGATHEYTIEWAALSQGEAGVTVQVDSDGDGTFEYTFSADNELTQEEFLSGTDGEPIPEFTTIAIPVAIVLGLVFLISRRKRKEE